MSERIITCIWLALFFGMVVLVHTQTPFPALLYNWLLIVAVAYIEVIINSFKADDFPYKLVFLASGVAVIDYLGLQLFFEKTPTYDFTITLMIFLVCVAAGDCMALLIGKKWGKSKTAKKVFKSKTALAPNISPNKTKVGAVAGVLSCAILLSIAFGEILNHSYFVGFIVGIVIGIVGALGDLAASIFKREVGVKDSGEFITGKILKGHGGFLDRFDSHLTVLTVWTLFVSFPKAIF